MKNNSIFPNFNYRKELCWPLAELAALPPSSPWKGVLQSNSSSVLREFIDLLRQAKQKPRDFLSFFFSARIAALPGPHWQPHPALLKDSLNSSFLFSSAIHQIKTNPFGRESTKIMRFTVKNKIIYIKSVTCWAQILSKYLRTFLLVLSQLLSFY